MTSIILNVTGARIEAAVNGPLTSGMVGIPVTIRYDGAWSGLTKNLVCRCGKWGPDKGETRTVLSIDKTATVAHEVMKADKHLYLGVEGYSADGKLVMPTTWADCGMIRHGANAGEDLSSDPKLSVWAQLQAQIEQIKQESITEDEIAAAIATYLEENPIEGSDSSQNANCLLTVETITIGEAGDIPVTGITLDYNSISLNAGDSIMLAASVSPSNATNNKVLWVSNNTEVATVNNGYVTAVSAGNTVITAYSAENNAIKATCSVAVSAETGGDKPAVTLTSISAVYSGGDVAVGMAVTDLTDIVVTAHYSDGTSEAVTGYTLSGTIVEGNNAITVSYGGKTATFTVTGVAESGTVKVYFTEHNIVEGKLIKVNGTTASVNGAMYVEIPYHDGMHIITNHSASWMTNYPPFIVFDNGSYSKAEYTEYEASAYQTTLTGFSANAKVYVNIKGYLINGKLYGNSTENPANLIEERCYYTYET